MSCVQWEAASTRSSHVFCHAACSHAYMYAWKHFTSASFAAVHTADDASGMHHSSSRHHDARIRPPPASAGEGLQVCCTEHIVRRRYFSPSLPPPDAQLATPLQASLVSRSVPGTRVPSQPIRPQRSPSSRILSHGHRRRHTRRHSRSIRPGCEPGRSIHLKAIKAPPRPSPTSPVLRRRPARVLTVCLAHAQ